MAAIEANGIRIEVETHGAASDPALVLIRGLGTQLIHWPESLLSGFVDRGFRVITFDNRDIGLSQKFDDAGVPNIAAAMARLGASEPYEPPYRLADMAADVIGVLDQLGIQRAHVAGLSMGGMIVQHIGANHGDRVSSLTSVMSTSGAPGLPPARPEAMAALLSRPEDPTDRDCVVTHGVGTQRRIGSPGFPSEESRLREMVSAAYDRCYHPAGVARQLLAVLSDGSRVPLLARIDAPTLVIHGEDDPLVPIEGGRDTARHITGARFHAIPGHGHDVPLQLVPRFVELIADHAATA